MAANDSRQSSPRHRAARELAELLETPDGARTARLLQKLGTLGESTSTEPPAPAAPPELEGPEEPRPIGIWQPRTIDGQLVFERPPVSPLGDHHASRRRLEAAKPAGSRRLGWFGESAAAGYLYAPQWTPAELIEHQLEDRRTDQHWQMIDLARTNERLTPLVDRIDAARQLDLDLLVVYAGNNWPLLELPEWSPYFPGVRSRQRWAAAWRRHGPGGPAQLAGQQLELKVHAALDQIERLADGRPLIWVIPAVDLADWQTAQPPTWLPDHGIARWHGLYAEARRALAAGKPEQVLRAAKEMATLDQGCNSTPHRLRALAHRLVGRLAKAQEAARAAIDRQNYAELAMLAAPQANSAIVELLRRAIPAKGWQVVDLPKLFARHAEAEPDKRSLFLDYCHLQAEGSRILSSAVVDLVVAGDKPTEVSTPTRDSCDTNCPQCSPTASVEATACLGAAIHGAHRLLPSGNKVAYLTTWLDRALDADPTCAAALLDLLEARITLPGEEILSEALRRNLASPHPLGLQHGLRWAHLDCDLLEAACRALEPHRADVRDWLTELLVKHHAADLQPRQLAAAPYLWEPLEQLFPEAIGDGSAMRSMVRSLWPTTRLALVSTGGAPIELRIVARLPPTPGLDPDRQGVAECQLEGRTVGELQLGCRWRRQTLVLKADDQRPGLQQLTICWPPPPPDGETALEAALNRLEEGIEADLHPIFGELASLVAAPVSNSPDREHVSEPQP